MPDGPYKGRLTPARRRLIDTLLDQLLEADNPTRARELEQIRARAPRIYPWVAALLDASDETCGGMYELFRRAGQVVCEQAQASMKVLEPGTCLGAWTVVEAIGHGGMGSVYRAERTDDSFEMTVAIKVIRSGKKNLDERLQIERRLLARLNHRNIARLIDGGMTSDGLTYLVMEWVEGYDLDEYLERQPCDFATRLNFFEQVVEAVAHAHQRQIVHGDLKPANVRVTISGQVRLVDFGVARLIQDERIEQQGSAIAMTPAFCAPEQLHGELASTQSDIWSLGVLLQWLLGGGIRQAKPGHTIAPELPVDLERRNDLVAIIDRACAEDPDQRYAGVPQLLEDVRHCRRGYPVQAREQTGAYVLSKFIRRHRVATGATLAGALLLLMAVAGALWQAHHATEQRDRAELETQRAVSAEQQAALLAGELQLVVDFQARRLAAIDATAMGAGLRSDILDQRRSALDGLLGDDDQIEHELHVLDESLGGVNFTDVALASMNRDIFAPTLRTIDQEFTAQPLLQARLLQVTATTMRELGIREQTEIPQARALEIRRQWLGDLDSDTLQSVYEMGALHGQMGRYELQRRYYKEAMNGFREKLGEDHLKTLRVTGSLGTHYFNSGDLERAGQLFSDTLERSRVALGATHEQTLASLSNMGSFLSSQGHLDEAKPYYREVLDIRRQTLGDRHPETLSSISNMGWLLQQKGHLDQALPYYREALEGRRTALGNEHPQTMVSVNNMGFLLNAMERPEQAMPYSLEAMNSARRLYGNDHHRTLIFINNSSSLVQSLGRYRQAEELAAEAVERGRRVLSSGHWHQGVFHARLGLALAAQGRYGEAETPMLEAYEIYREELGEDHDRTLDIALELHGLYAAWHETDPGAGHDIEQKRWARDPVAPQEPQGQW